MLKFKCLCGEQFNTKGLSTIHEMLNKGHKVIKKSLWKNILDGFFSVPGIKIIRISGAYLILIILFNHFKVQLSSFESFLIGIGLSFYVD